MKKTGFVLVGILIIIVTIIFLSNRGVPEVKASSELLEWEAKAKIFDFNGHKISYHDTKGSSKEIVLLIHGFPTASWDWRFVWSQLRGEYRLITLDMLGFGLSDKPRDKVYSIDEQADIQEALLKHLAITGVNILAHDYGDIVAQEMVARFNERKNDDSKINIKSLVLLNGGIFPEQHKPRIIQTLLNSPVGSLVSMFSTQQIFDKSFTPVFGEKTKPTKQELNDLWYLITRQDGHQLSHKLIHYLNDRFEYRERWVGALQLTEIPMLLIDGTVDPVAGKQTVERYIELIPNPNVIELENVGHYPHTESPEKVVKHYKDFISSS